MQSAINTETDQADIKYNINCLTDNLSDFDKWFETLKNEEFRRSIIEEGYTQAHDFLDKLTLPV
jgi:hypothetical protein